MKAVLLAGGLGTRIAEETSVRPKPMVEIGGKPILWHVMKIFSHYGVNDFIVCCGYKGYVIKEFFANYFLHTSDVTFDLSTNSMQVHEQYAEPWKVTLVDTGQDTQTGGRVKRIAKYLNPDESFLLTYGDGLSNVDIDKLVGFHHAHGKLATLTAVVPPSRFGVLDVSDTHRVRSFKEKPTGEGGLINGGFFVLRPEVLQLIEGDSVVWEREPLEQLALAGELMAFSHGGFWYPMDTLRDKQLLESMWVSGESPWKVWE